MHVLSTAINVPTRWPIGLLTVSNILLRVAMKFKYTLFNSIQFRCHVSGVRCHVFFFFFSDKVLKLVGGGSVINGAYPV